jgi:hypothetical protein
MDNQKEDKQYQLTEKGKELAEQLAKKNIEKDKAQAKIQESLAGEKILSSIELKKQLDEVNRQIKEIENLEKQKKVEWTRTKKDNNKDGQNYYKAKQIRKTGFTDLMADKLLEGQGIGESFKKTLSEKTKAKITGIKQTFDPLNIAKFVTGGSNLAPALLGKILGRSKQDVKFFTGRTRKGRDTASKLGPTESGDFNGILYNIENLLKTSMEEDKLQRDKENTFAEEKEAERLRRHKELIEALTGKKYETKEKQSAEKIQENKDSFLDNALAAFGGLALAKSALSTLATVAKFFAFNPVGLAIIGSVALGALFWKLFSDKSGYEDPNSDLSRGLKQAESVGGLAGVKDEAERRKKMPEYDRTMAEIKDFEEFQNEGQKLNNTQLQGFAKRGPGALEAVEDYKIAREKYFKITGESNTVPGQVPMAESDTETIPASATPSSTSSGTSSGTASSASSGTETAIPFATSSSTATPVASGKETSIPAASSTATSTNTSSTALPTSNLGETLNTVTNENLTTKIQETLSEGLNVVNNSAIKQAIRSKEVKTSIPPVRNMEESFQKMIYESTRVV